ncbi:hypothetical protein E3N88_02202 [Mikania micrantha]|uniref:Auxin efflux carrier component n=1 Tax=Mikania micrantha TaxID=192012 RepID=A0A5N6Q4S1_9ASTR|nr:hypothetical protein E3N88_02202 [Mikania micrantha]
MGFLDLFSAASMPVLKVLIVTALGSFLALDSINILGQSARKHVNELVFFVFNPALVGSNLANTITYESLISLWFMPVNILLTFIIGSVLGWVLILIAKPSQHLRGLVLGTCSAGNLGNMLLIIVPAVCKEKGTPFGDADVCSEYGMAYASLSMAIGAVFLWSYVYNLVRVFSEDSGTIQTETVQEDLTIPLLPSSESTAPIEGKMKVMLNGMKRRWGNFSKRVNLSAIFAPSTTGAIVGFVIGTIAPIRNLLIGTTAPLRVIQDSASLVGCGHRFGEREDGFIKDNMSGGDELVGDEVKAGITPMIGGVTEEDTHGRAVTELVNGGRGSSVWAREAEGHAIGFAEGVEEIVVEFSDIVTL